MTLNGESELVPIMIDSPQCEIVQNACKDQDQLLILAERDQIDLLYHLRKCNTCRNALSAEQYLGAVQSLVIFRH